MIKPVSFVKQFEGKSNSYLITFSDGRDYVVKYFHTGFEKALPNEWIAYCVARFLDLPIPFAQIVQIPVEFSSQIPHLTQEVIDNSQYQFASLYVPNCKDGHQVSTIQHIVNSRDLPGIILFDYWLSNEDRTRKNILLHEENANNYHLWIIDHAEIFGSYSWLVPELEYLPQKIMKSATHQIMAGYIDQEKEFWKQLDIIQTFPILLLEEIVECIPEDWLVTKEEKKAIVGRLVNRRKKTLPLLLKKFLINIYRPSKKINKKF